MKPLTAIDKELASLAKKHDGVLRPEDVVAFAKNPKTALHARFTWDDTEAAAEYRLWQARQLIRVRVTTIPQDKENRSVRAYVSLTPDRAKEGGGYRETVTVLSDKEMRQQMLDDALGELDAFQRKYRTLSALAPIFEAIEKVKAKAKRQDVPAMASV